MRRPIVFFAALAVALTLLPPGYLGRTAHADEGQSTPGTLWAAPTTDGGTPTHGMPVAFGHGAGNGTIVDAANPLPVAAAPLAGGGVTGRTYTPIATDQVEAISIAANAARLSIVCQNVGTEPAMVRVGASSGGTTGLVLGGGGGSLDGTGGVWNTSDPGAVYFYDIDGNGLADVQCAEETG